jgi:hypothetical protein
LVVELDALLRGLEKNSHDLRSIMSPHTYVILMSKLAKRDRKEKCRGIIRRR